MIESEDIIKEIWAHPNTEKIKELIEEGFKQREKVAAQDILAAFKEYCGNWIPVQYALPPLFRNVFVMCDRTESTLYCHYAVARRWTGCSFRYEEACEIWDWITPNDRLVPNVTHWFPIPLSRMSTTFKEETEHEQGRGNTLGMGKS